MRQQQVQIKIRIRVYNSFITVRNTFLIKPFTTNEELSFKLQKNTKCKNASMALQTCFCFQKNQKNPPKHTQNPKIKKYFHWKNYINTSYDHSFISNANLDIKQQQHWSNI